MLPSADFESAASASSATAACYEENDTKETEESQDNLLYACGRHYFTSAFNVYVEGTKWYNDKESEGKEDRDD